MPIRLCRLRPGDEQLLDQVAAEVFDEPVQVGRLAAYLARPGHLMVLAIEGDLVVGQCAGVIHAHPDKATELYVDEVGTATSHLRQGIATAMLDELFAWGRELGCEEAWLGTELDNRAANGTQLLEFAERFRGPEGMSVIVGDHDGASQRFFERHDFSEAARRPMVKDGWQKPGTEWILLTKP